MGSSNSTNIDPNALNSLRQLDVDLDDEYFLHGHEDEFEDYGDDFDPMVYDHNYDNFSQSSHNHSQNNYESLPDLFREFLINLEKNPKLAFRFRRFRTCSIEDLEECAGILQDAVLFQPKVLLPATNVVRTIQANPSDDENDPYTFMYYLEERIESDIKYLLQQQQKWTPLRNIGKFLAILYNKDAISNATMNIWLDGVQDFVSKNNVNATKNLLDVLQVILKKMETRAQSMFKFYVTELERISRVAANRPPHIAAWVDSTVKKILREVRTTSDNQAHHSSNSNFQVVHAGYAVFVPDDPELFQKFLKDLKPTSELAFNVKLFENCSENDRKKCAQLALEAVLTDPKIIEPLARFMQTIQCSATPTKAKHLKLSDHLTILIESRIDHLVRQESKWVPLGIIGSFLAQMYNFECIKNDTMNKWFDGLQPFVANKNAKGTNVYLLVLKLCSEKLKQKNLPKFNFHVQQLQNMSPLVWLSDDLRVWKINFLKLHSKKNAPGTSNAANVQQQQQQSTGAIRKTTTDRTPVLVPQKLSSVNPASLLDLSDPQLHSSSSSSSSYPAAFDRSTRDFLVVPTLLTPTPAPPVVAPVASNSSTSVSLVHEKLNKLYGGHDALQILDEIVALKVEMSADNLRKITNMFAQKIIGKSGIIKSCVEILANLPHRSIPPFDPKELKMPLNLSILDQISHFRKRQLSNGTTNDSALNDILMFMTQLHSRNVIEADVIVEMIEQVVATSRDEAISSINLITKFLETFSAVLGAKVEKLKETKKFFEQFRDVHDGLSNEHLINIARATNLIAFKGETVKLKLPVECRPSTSSASIVVDNKQKFLGILLDLPVKSVEDIRNFAAQIKTHLNCDEFAAAFYEAALKTELFSLYGEIAQTIEHEVPAELKNLLSKSTVKFLYASYLPLTPEEMKASRGAKNRLQFIGELYKIGWISIDELVTVFDKLSETELLVRLFHTLLSIVAFSVAKNGDGENVMKYREIYAKRQDGYKNSTDYLKCRESIRILDDIADLSTKRVVFDAKAVKNIVDGVNANNSEEQANKINSLGGRTAADVEVIFKAVLNKLTDSDDDQLMASFICKLLETVEHKEAFNAIIVDKCQEMLISKFLQPENDKNLPSAFTIIAVFGQLYRMNVLKSDFIALCCEILVDSQVENKNACLYILSLEVGEKLDAENQKTATKNFQNFCKIAKEKETERSQAENLQNLIEMRANAWRPAKSSKSSQHSVALLQNLTRSNLISASTSKEIVKLCESSPEELVTSFYFSVIRHPDKADLYADLCVIIQKHQPELKDYLKDCLRSRVVSVADLKKQNLDEEARSDLAASMIFIGELYSRGLIDDDLAAFLLKPAKHLCFNSINQLTSVIGEKVSGGNNIRMKALLMILEEAAQDEAKQFWDDLKRDISEITEVVTRSNEQSSQEAGEASEGQP